MAGGFPQPTGIVDNEGGGAIRTKQDGIEFIPTREFEDRFDDATSREPTESHKGVGFIFVVFSMIVILCMAVSIEIINGGNIWGLGETLGLGDLFPVTYEAPQYIPPRACGDKNGDGVPDETLFNCSAGAVRASGMSANGGDFSSFAVVSPRNEIFCTPEGTKCQQTQCCVDLGPDCTPGVPGTAWELGDGGCAAGLSTTSACQEVRLPDTPTAAECKALVEQANTDFAAGRSPTVYPTELRYPNPNTWPPTVNDAQISLGTANGVSWGRGSEPVRERTRGHAIGTHARAASVCNLTDSPLSRNQDPDRITFSLVDTDINHGSYKQCWAEFGMTEVKKNYYNSDGKLIDMTDLYQTCRLI
eukprot:COSAG02_NODE_5589_length_4207_cov_3.451558_2_plen_360_part_00